MTQKAYLNLGCGNIHLPGERPAHHGLVDAAIYDYPLWWNVDRNAGAGVDFVTDLFRYPWPMDSNGFDGAVLTHLAEHIPHGIRHDETPRGLALGELQDGWFAFWAELWRVLTPGAMVHVLSPYGWSDGAITDPTHTRMLTPHSFLHSMTPNPDAPFAYATDGIHFEMVGAPVYAVHPDYVDLSDNPTLFGDLLRSRINVVHEFYVRLRCVK